MNTDKYLNQNVSVLRGTDIGTLYPILDYDNSTIVGFYSAEFGTPIGYRLDEKLQAFVIASNTEI
jgi:hypothetical protein